MSFRNIITTDVRFFVFQVKDMTMLPELQAAYIQALLIDKLGMDRNSVRVHSCYQTKKFYKELTSNINRYKEENYFFFAENYYHSSSYAINEIETIISMTPNKNIYIHSHKLSLNDSVEFMKRNANVKMIIRTDVEYVALQELLYNKPLRDIPNIVFRDSDGNIVATKSEDVDYDLSEYIFPAYSNGKIIEEKDNVSRVVSLLDEDTEATDPAFIYRRPRAEMVDFLYSAEYYKTAMLTTGRGCKYKCSYCFRGVKYSSVRQIPLSVVEADLEYLASAGVKNIYFFDDCFVTTNKNRLAAVVELMNRFPFSYYIATRYEACDEESLSLLATVNFSKVQIGLQSITHNSAHKRSFNHEKLVRTFDALNTQRDKISIDIILGLPGETKDDFLATLDFALNLRPGMIVVNTLFVNPGTELDTKANDFKIKVNQTVSFNVPVITESATFSKEDLAYCRTILTNLFHSQKDIKLIIR